MPKEKKESGRMRLFKVLAKLPEHSDGISLREIYKRLNVPYGSGQPPILLRGEVTAKRVRCQLDPDTDAKVYRLTALGREHLKAGKVNSYSREKHLVALGRPWDSNPDGTPKSSKPKKKNPRSKKPAPNKVNKAESPAKKPKSSPKKNPKAKPTPKAVKATKPAPKAKKKPPPTPKPVQEPQVAEAAEAAPAAAVA